MVRAWVASGAAFALSLTASADVTYTGADETSPLDLSLTKNWSAAPNLLKPGGAVLFEIGENQGEALLRLFVDYGFSNAKIEKDFAGHDRYASAILA